MTDSASPKIRQALQLVFAKLARAEPHPYLHRFT